MIEAGHFGKSSEQIVVIPNFVKKDELEIIKRFLPRINRWVDPGESIFSDSGVCTYDADYWRHRQCSGDIIKELDETIFLLIDELIQRMRIVLEERFNVFLRSRPPVLVRWTPGTEQQPHADKQLNDGTPNPFPDYDINSLIYYNDEFTGGELYYPDHGIEIKPEPGLAVAHPGDIFFLHGVKTITSGERWTTPSFYSVIGNESDSSERHHAYNANR